MQNCPYRVLRSLEIVNYRQGQFICQQEAPQNNLYITISGKVEVYYLADNGKKHSQSFLTEGTFFGELELFDKRHSSSYVKALTQVNLLRVKRDIFLQWLKEDGNFSEYIFKQISAKFYNYSLNTSKCLLYSAKRRICEYLVSSYTEDNTNNAKIRFDKNKISKTMLISTRNLNRTLQSLKELDAIEIEKNTVIVKNLEILKSIDENCDIKDDEE